MTNINQQSISFTSRCQSIEMARNACRKISLYSTTKKQPIINDLRYRCSEEMFPNYGFEGKKNNPLKDKSKAYSVLRAYSRCSDKLVENRENFAQKRDLTGAQRLLNVVKNTHVGNCGESAESVALILNMNGIKNTYITTIKTDSVPIDHEVCLFNRNGSTFNGEISNNQTIVIDPWLGIVDFAGTAFKKIKHNCKRFFYMNPNKDIQINLEELASFNLTDEEINILRKQYPEFVMKK